MQPTAIYNYKLNYMLLYIFIALVLVLLNEYRLINKYILAHNDIHEKSKIEKFFLVLIKPFLLVKNWIKNKVLNDELNYN
jgi:riboflavin transporter FmnP